ncbi:peptide-methionine (S)-S-oxide reductase MsrA [Hathewaya massiliensis]|uniref:peptide-methionine (S)-S-oxide reductase MsrA n=1 Tax=Hathewaya massiliensis TaxID=1964382 RepID=UPI00163CE293|nr:peptide-methionine (S)-S-oxide reductase MsrA [Hathewaya massiliensis]
MHNKNIKTAYFAGGCFWCMVDCFYLLEGVIDVKVGYSGGNTKQPTYEEVKSQKTGHYETAMVVYDSSITPYKELLSMFWRQIDPTDDGGQFQDRGSSYKTAIFYESDEEKIMAENSILDLKKSNKFSKPIVTKLLPLKNFYLAEDYHQNFPANNPNEYKEDREKSGRDNFLNKIWS